MDGPPPRRIPPLIDVVPPRVDSAENTSDAAKAMNPNERKAVTACASRHLFPGLSDPLVMPLEWI